MTEFRKDPENESGATILSNRSDEIGVASRELAVMQQELRTALKQKTRLAALGAAVAKINHDLRNSLATAVLVSDRLANIDDPEVKRVTPRLYDSINRAVILCGQTLTFVGDGSPEMKPTLFHLHELVAEVGAALRSTDLAALGLEQPRVLDWQNKVDFELDLEADRQQLFRVFSNLGQNAYQAGASEVRISADAVGDDIGIDIADNGPGLAREAVDQLYKPFSGSLRDGGTGLGLVIARDIMHAHNGEIILLETGKSGTTFRLNVPRRVAE